MPAKFCLHDISRLRQDVGGRENSFMTCSSMAIQNDSLITVLLLEDSMNGAARTIPKTPHGKLDFCNKSKIVLQEIHNIFIT